MVDLYDFKFKYNHERGDKVIWNKKVFRNCPFKVDEIKTVGAVTPNHCAIVDIRGWYSWWEIVPKSIIKRPMYWVRYYLWEHFKHDKQIMERLEYDRLGE